MGKINVAEILKDCPQGMKLDCTIFDNVTFDCVADGGIWIKHIDSKDGEHSLYVYNDGSFPIHNLGSLRTKCVIFPNGKTSWDGFVPPCKFKEPCKFKDGDVVVAENKNDKSLQLFLLERLTHSENANRHDGDCYFGWDFQCNALFEKGNWSFSRLATEEEKQKFFDTIKANGYKLNPVTKTPEKLIEPKFHEGDWIVQGCNILKIRCVGNEYYCIETVGGYVDDMLVSEIDSLYHRWTIQDAKEGDVLAINWYKGDDYWEKIIIFKKYHNGDVTVEGYGNTFKNGELVLNKEVPFFSKTWTVSLHPATKEQRELLFQKIKEAGYKWNAETKTPEKLIEPKFKVGNWIVFNGLTLYIKEIVKGFYRTISKGDGIANSYDWGIDNAARLWTIEDAKDGDVLAFNDETIVIFKDLYNKTSFHSYCHVEDGIFTISKEDMPDWWEGEEFYPATKEQRELLFQKIKEAGYKWNTETKIPEKLPIEKSEIENNIVDIVKENDDRFRIVLNHQYDMEVDEGEYYAVRRPELSSNIWHDIDEEPIYVNGKTPLIIDSNYGHISREGHYYDQFQWKHHIESQQHREFKWAYEKDLMNL